MKVLRVLRRRKIRLSFIFILLLVFIFNSYAWISYSNTTSTGALVANVSSWAVEFLIHDEDEKLEEYTYEIDEFHPGIEPIEKKISIYNVGDANSHVRYRIREIYLYGEQILKVGDAEDLIPETVGEAVSNADGWTVNAFGNESASIFEVVDTETETTDAADATETGDAVVEGTTENENYTFSLRYPTPFTISYTYDKIYVSGNNGVASSKASVTLNLAWYNDESNNVEDTKLGNLAYEFKKNNPDEPALKILFEVAGIRDRE